MLILKTDIPYHTKLKENRKRLLFACIQSYQRAQQPPMKRDGQNQSQYLQALRDYILHINSGTTRISLTDEHYLELIKKTSREQRIQYFDLITTRCKNVAEARIRRLMIQTCFLEILIPVLATILPSFIIGAGIATVITHTGTLAAIIFFFALGSLILAGSQLYLWMHHRKDVPNRVQRINQLFSDLHHRPIEKQDIFEGEVFANNLLQNVLDNKETVDKLEKCIDNTWWCFSGLTKFLTLHNPQNQFYQKVP